MYNRQSSPLRRSLRLQQLLHGGGFFGLLSWTKVKSAVKVDSGTARMTRLTPSGQMLDVSSFFARVNTEIISVLRNEVATNGPVKSKLTVDVVLTRGKGDETKRFTSGEFSQLQTLVPFKSAADVSINVFAMISLVRQKLDDFIERDPSWRFVRGVSVEVGVINDTLLIKKLEQKAVAKKSPVRAKSEPVALKRIKSPKKVQSEKRKRYVLDDSIIAQKASQQKMDAVESLLATEEALKKELAKIFAAEPDQTAKAAKEKAEAYTKFIVEREGLVPSETAYKVDKTLVLPKRIIGQGGFGCITLPAVPCEGMKESEYKGLVSKVLNAEEASKELKEGDNLSKIDTLVSGRQYTTSARYRFGVYALDKCPFPLLNDKEIQSFDNAENGPCDAGSARSLGYVLHLEKADADCSELEYIVTPSTIKPWLIALKNALEGLINMHKHDIYHFDVKPQNMLYFLDADKYPKTIKLNDFGLTTSLNDPKFNEVYALNRPYFNFPPISSVIATHFIFTNRNIAGAIKRANEYFNAIQAFLRIKCIDQDVYQNKGIIAAAEGWNAGKNIREIASRIDLYGFALTLDKFYRHASSEMKPIISNFCSNVAKMRWSSETALKEYNELLR